MHTHRYQYLYLPFARFCRKLSPSRQLLLTLAKLSLVLILLVTLGLPSSSSETTVQLASERQHAIALALWRDFRIGLERAD